MGDYSDYRIRKMEIAWKLAERIIPSQPWDGGVWSEGQFIARAQQVLKSANEAVQAVFIESEA